LPVPFAIGLEPMAPRWLTTDQDDVVGAVDELAAVTLAAQGLVDLAGREVEAGEVLVGREACRLEVIGNGADLAFRDLGLQQL
jgi:hypothetical protein